MQLICKFNFRLKWLKFFNYYPHLQIPPKSRLVLALSSVVF
nr:MAG TPA: hypothetical protein [Bacteriophage sp.]